MGLLPSALRKSILAAPLVFLSIHSNANAAEHWIRLTTPHFEMYTTDDEKQAIAALKVFEQVRYFFLQNSPAKTAPSLPVRIIAFHSEREFKPYRLNEGSFAYYVRSRKTDYIVMQDISSEHYQAAVHEYTHLIAEDRKLALPLWLNEGLADVYSSLETRGNQALVGRALPGRLYTLAGQPWLDMNTLFGVGHDSPYYNESSKMSIFYAQSWALTHMLSLGKDYAAGFPQFLAAIVSGAPPVDCFRTVYGKTLPKVTSDLRAYVDQTTMRAAVFNIKLDKAELDPETSEPSELSVNLALADLLAAQRRSQQEASARLSKIAASHPESAEVQESLGYLAWAQGDSSKAKECFKLAFDRNSKNPEMLNSYAELLLAASAPGAEIIPVLRRAVECKPDYQEAWFNLGLTYVRTGQYGGALAALSQIKTVTAERAYSLFSLKAYCDLQLKAPKPARELAEKAKPYAKTPDEQLQISNILSAVDAFERQGSVSTDVSLPSDSASLSMDDERPTLRRAARREIPRDQPTIIPAEKMQHVEGIAKTFDCDSKSLRVLVGSHEMSFGIDDPDRVVVRNKPNGTIDFQCGPQNSVKVGIFYIPATQPSKMDGIIRELVF